MATIDCLLKEIRVYKKISFSIAILCLVLSGGENRAGTCNLTMNAPANGFAVSIAPPTNGVITASGKETIRPKVKIRWMRPGKMDSVVNFTVLANDTWSDTQTFTQASPLYVSAQSMSNAEVLDTCLQYRGGSIL